MIQPQHMAVRKPAHINNVDLQNHGRAVSIPRAQPTDMSYFLERLRLAELSRMLVDRSPLAYTNAVDRKYDQVIETDLQLQQYQQSLPTFFQIENSGLGDVSISHPQGSPAIIVQKINLNCLVYYQRCTIHLPYIALSAVDPQYASSRRVCLDCAERVVHLHKEARANHSSWIMSRLKATNMLRSLILAGMVFLLDICSGIEVENLKAERPEVFEAWQLMSGFQEHSHLVEQFFEFSAQMLKKYRVSENVLQLLQSIGPYLDLRGGFGMPGASAYESDHEQEHWPENPADGEDQRWKTLGNDFDLNAMSWDGMSWAFEAMFM